MYKIAILGCENSHANTFLGFIIRDKLYPDIEVMGVYSDDSTAAKKTAETFGLHIMDRYDELVGKIDGLIIVSRHGGKHYKMAAPYIKSGIPMFIDKPITVSEDDAIAFKAELIDNGVKVCGGSVCQFADFVQDLKSSVKEKTYGEVYGGTLRAPVDMVNDHGNFYFYSQHLVQTMVEIFGYYPTKVFANKNGKTVKCIVSYDKYDVVLEFVDKNYDFYAGISCERDSVYSKFGMDGCFKKEFDTFYSLLCGKEQVQSYDEFFAPVHILNAIERSYESGLVQKILYG